MKCRDAVEMINSYMDNRTDPMNDKVLAEHIRSCDKCRSELEYLIKYRNIVRTVKPVNPPESFLADLRERIEKEKKTGIIKRITAGAGHYFSGLSFPMEAAGVLAAAAVVFILYRPFFNEKKQDMFSESAIEIPQNGVTTHKEEKVIQQKKAKNQHASDLPSIGRKPVYDKGAVKDDEDKSVSDIPSPAWDNGISSKASEEDNISGDMLKTESIAENEKIAERKLGPGDKVFGERKKEAVRPVFSEAESVFIEFGASLVMKDASGAGKIFYRIKIDAGKHIPMMKKLEEKYNVDIKRVIKNNNYSEIEFFLKKR